MVNAAMRGVTRLLPAWTEAIKQFKATHPGVEVQFEEKGFEQIRQSAQMILGSDQAPDVMEYNKGNATAGLLSKQGLLTGLTAEATPRAAGTNSSTPACRPRPGTNPTA